MPNPRDEQQDAAGPGEDSGEVQPTEIHGPPVSELVAPTGAAGHAPAEIREADFATTLRGYDRAQVDAYVERVNQVVAELEVNRSPEGAVKAALDRVGEQTAGVLQRAREVAEELTSTAFGESEHVTRRARVESAELMERAQSESREMLERAREEAEELVAAAQNEAAERLSLVHQRIEAAQADSETRLAALGAEIEQAHSERQVALGQLRTISASLDAFALDTERGSRPVFDGATLDRPGTEEGDAAEGADAQSGGTAEDTDAHAGRTAAVPSPEEEQPTQVTLPISPARQPQRQKRPRPPRPPKPAQAGRSRSS